MTKVAFRSRESRATFAERKATIADPLLTHFDRLADAPDAIPRLRKFILDLAVRGKLVEQEPKDEPAEELVKRIQDEKARLAKAGEIRKPKPFPPIESDEIPFEAPSRWKWVRMREATSDRGQTVPNEEFTYIDVSAINKEAGFVEEPQVLSADDAPSRARKVVQTGDVIYSCVRPYLLNVAVIDREIVPTPIASTAFAVINGFGLVLPRYLWIVLRSPMMVECVESKMRGQAYPAINDSDFALLPLPLPPLAEQHRIVAKVNELMALCDQLEKAQQERETRRDRLVAAVHSGVSGPKSQIPNPKSQISSPLLHHLPSLTTRPEHIQNLRQTILNLAVRGKLLPQSRSDEPSSTLLHRIDSQRAALIKKGAIRNRPSSAPISKDLQPFEIPSTWSWVRFGEVIFDSEAGWSPRTEGFPRSGKNWGVLKVSAVSWDKFLPEENKQLLPGVEPLKSAQVRKGDFLISRANTSELVAKCVIVDDEPQNLTLSDKTVRLQIAPDCNQRFLAIVNNYSRHARAYYAEEASGTSLSMKNVSRPVIYSLAVPLPPLAEQHRIVAKVDQLMALADQLEAELTTRARDSRRLLEAILHEALM